MAINKKLRQQVLDKYDCKCGYCGCNIDIKTMQVDHIFPQRLSHFLGKQDIVSRNLQNKIPVSLMDINDSDNLMPACKVCNHYKRGYTLNAFRELLLSLNQRIEANYINRVGVKYGIISEPKGWDGVFYFEKCTGIGWHSTIL